MKGATDTAALSVNLRPGETFAPMHWTVQVSRAGRVNAAVNPAVAPISGQPELKHTPVGIRTLAVRWHGTILARRPVMLPQVAYWTHATAAGHHASLVAGEKLLTSARRALSAVWRAALPQSGEAASLDAVGAATRAGMNCGSCRPEIRLLLRAARPKKAA